MALSAPDGTASLQDLISQLRRDGSTDAVFESQEALVDAHGEITEQIAESVFYEIQDRANAAGPGYPFIVTEQSIRHQQPTEDCVWTYEFLLLLSVFGVDAGKSSRTRPERDFEDISIAATEQFFGCNQHDGSYLFAFPRRTGPRGFTAAVDALCRTIGEGGGASGLPVARDQKDGRLDVVVWHGFPDDKPGRMIAFGQCAAGKDWKSKVGDLPDTGKWCQVWMTSPPAEDPVRMLFVPHRLNRGEWTTQAIFAGIVFERCRISYFAPCVPSAVATRVKRWMTKVRAHFMRSRW